MHDNELKKLLLETYPVRPGQEERAWNALKGCLTPPSRWVWVFYPTWRGAAVGLGVVMALAYVGSLVTLQPDRPSFVSADSQAPGIYATAFYSKSARAQVVWLNGLEPLTDQPTYLDPTTDVRSTRAQKVRQPTGDPNSL